MSVPSTQPAADSNCDSRQRLLADEGITETELTFTRRALGQRDARDYETPAQKVNFIARILDFELDDVASRHLTMDDMIIVVVGDRETVLPQLEPLGYDIVEVDESGAPLPAAAG